MYQLVDTFNNVVISRHRTATNAGKAAKKFLAAVKRNNGAGSYIPLQLQKSYVDKGEVGGVSYSLASDELDHADFDAALLD